MIGFLDRDGKFTECSSWEHTSMAEKICKEKYNEDKDGILAEDYLLSRGYLVIRARDAYMSYWDKTGIGKTLSEEQLNWIYDHADDFIDDVKEDINEILLDNEYFAKRGYESLT